MAVPTIAYGTKTVSLTELPSEFRQLVAPPRAVNTSLVGTSDTVLVPRLDRHISMDWPPVDSGTLRVSLLNWYQAACQGKPSAFAADGSKVVNTMTIGTAAAAATAVVVASATGITSGQIYRIIDGPFEQYITVSSISANTINFTATPLDVAVSNAIFRDQFYFPMVLRDSSPASAVIDVPASELAAFPLAKFRLALDFTEDTSHLYRGLVAYYRFEEASGTRYDELGLHDLTATNAPVSGTGKQGTCVDIELSSVQYLSCKVREGDALYMGDVDMAVAVWVKLESKATGQVICGQFDNSSVPLQSWLLQYEVGADRFQFFVADPNGTNTRVSANVLGSPSTATWYRIVGWRDKAAGTINIQVNNGTADTVSTALYPGAVTTDFTVGDIYGSGIGFDGLIDELAIFKRIPTSTERTADYAAGSGIPFSASLAYFSV